jgi:mono/diheme cytochrome c family protein
VYLFVLHHAEQFMSNIRSGIIGVAFLSIVLVAAGLAAAQQDASKSSTPAAQRALIDRYCLGCHNQRNSNGLALDGKSVDLSHVGSDAEKFEKVVRKLRAGMMPPSGAARPPAADLEALIVWLENELDQNVISQPPPPGLHRLNRTEYSNVIGDLLGLFLCNFSVKRGEVGKITPTLSAES